jgi:hypothetical protein
MISPRLSLRGIVGACSLQAVRRSKRERIIKRYMKLDCRFTLLSFPGPIALRLPSEVLGKVAMAQVVRWRVVF